MFRLVYTSEGTWKAYTIYTSLQSLNDYPEKVGAQRNHVSNHGKWVEQRQKEIEFEGVEPMSSLSEAVRADWTLALD